MTPKTHEQTINTALGEVVEALGQDWIVHSEQIGGIFEGGGRPDLLIEKSGGWPIVIEAEVGNHGQAEREAEDRLGRRLVTSGGTVDAAFALVYPDEIRNYSGAELRTALNEADLEYALYVRSAGGGATRLPAAGWLSGGVRDLALLLHRSSIPAWRVETLADALELGVMRAEAAFSASHPMGSPLGIQVGDVLGQSDDEAGQTRRMAMTVILNALVFHEALAEAEMLVGDGASSQRTVRPPRSFRGDGSFLPTGLLDEWASILGVNYWPIFHTAGAILRELPTPTASTILDTLWETAEVLIAGGVTRSHDLTGIVFQRLIADRKFLATYYTRPAAAALLADLAMPTTLPIRGDSWADHDAIRSVRIGDFACGTGTLLSTAYQRLSLLHEVHGGDPRALHPAMMKDGLVGLDVLNVAVHLTAAMLAGVHPDTPFEGECLLTMPYGRHDWGVSVGSLDLLEPQGMFEMMQAAAHTAGGRGEEEVRDLLERVGHGQFDLVIMNPPFTRHGAREGDRTLVHNPAFAAFEATEQEQDVLSSHLRSIAAGGYAHGHAGLASYFVDLAHRKTAEAGTIALVLPLSAMSGGSWEKVRNLWRDEYSSLVVVTIAERGTHTRSFSADTGMAECLLTAKKLRSRDSVPRAVFVVLQGQPQSTIEGELLAETIVKACARGEVRQLEDGPFGGSSLFVGATEVGRILDCPLPAEGPWQMVGISDMSLGQTAHQLLTGRLWVEGMAADSVANLPIATIGDVASRIGPHHLDITGSKVKPDGLPQGPFQKIAGCASGDAHPCLWNHDSTRERRLAVLPDHHLRVRGVAGRIPDKLRERAEDRWATASRAHYNQDFQFNSQSLVVAMTDRPAIGGRAWPSVIFDDPSHEYAFALWCNSTLGLLCHWWMSNKSQAGRGSTTITAIPLVSTLDLRMLTPEQHETAKRIFEDMQDERFLPFDQIDEDPARARLDRELVVDVIGADEAVCRAGGPLDLLRRKLAAEPQVHANKQTRVVFTEEGEENVLRTPEETT